jgi:hypothetical protein
MKLALAASLALLAAAPAPARAWGRWLGDTAACPAPEKQNFMHPGKKDTPYCAPRGKCGPDRKRVELIDSSGWDFSVCVNASVTPPPIALKITCPEGERVAYRNPLERSGAFCAAVKGKCAEGHALAKDKDVHGFSTSSCGKGAPAGASPASSHAQAASCAEPEIVAHRKNEEGKDATFCAPGPVKDNYKFSHQMACAKGRHEGSILDYTTDPAEGRSRRACKD